MSNDEPQNPQDELDQGTDDQAESDEGSREQVTEERLSGEDIRTALIDGETFTAKPVQYVVVGELAIFEGDIVLGRVEDVERRSEEIAQRVATGSAGIGDGATEGDEVDPNLTDIASAVAVSGTGRRWPGGVIPFEIDPALPAAQQTAARNAVAHWEENTRLSLPPHQAGDSQWIHFWAGDGCSSPVGRQGTGLFTPPPQNISLASGCMTGQAIHEVGHAVGLWHEQSREDRDTFVTINFANILAQKEHNFDQHISDGDDVGAYDFGSIMHYGPTAFGKANPAGGTLTTISPKVPLPAGVVMGQRTGLSRSDRAAVAWMYPDVYPSPVNTWPGRFRGTAAEELLYYSPARRRWFLSVNTGGTLSFRDIGGRPTFGDVIDGRPLWIGDFTGDGRSDVLTYNPADDNWWLGQVISEDAACSGLRSQKRTLQQQINQLIAARNALNPRDPQDRAEIQQLNAQIGQLRTQLQGVQTDMGNRRCPVDPPPNTAGEVMSWSLVGNTAGFGHAINDGRPFWVGDFTGGGSTDVLFYYPGDDNWWLGTIQGGQLTWSLVGNTAGFGHAINDGRPFWVGDFTGGGSTDVLFYYPGDDNWWLGTIQGGQLTWSHVGNTAGFGHAINDGRPFWIGDFTGNGSDDVLFYFPGDDNWWLGTMQGGQLTWSFVGNTAGFGHAINDGRPFWIGDFTGGGAADVLFYFPGDDNWWLGTLTDVPPENAQCQTLRDSIIAARAEIRSLEKVKRTLNPRDPIDRREILEINRQITALNQRITAANAQMASLACPATPNPGGKQLSWSHAGNTAGFGHAINDGRPFWIGDFTGDGGTDVLFHYRGDLNWWRGSVSGTTLGWTLAATW